MTERALASSRPAANALRRLGFLLPILVFVMVAVGLGIGLTRNPQEIPSALIGKPVPEFSLLPVVPVLDTGLSPLVQWIVIPIAAFWWARRPVRKANP